MSCHRASLNLLLCAACLKELIQVVKWMLLEMFLNPFWGTPLPRFPSQPSLSKRNTAQSKRAFLGLHRRRLSYWNSDCSGRFDMEQDITCFPRRPVPDCSRRLRVLLFKSSRFLVIIGSNSWNHVVSPQSLSSVTAVTIFQRNVLQLVWKVKVGKHLLLRKPNATEPLLLSGKV